MKSRKRLVIALIFLGLIASAAVYWKFPRETSEKVTVLEASWGTIEQTIASVGAVEARRKILVTGEPGMRIAALYFAEQDVVAKGQELAKLDDIELVTQLRHMEGALKLAVANLATAEASLQQSKALYEKGYIARQEVEAAQRQVGISQAQVEEKQASIQLLKAKRERTVIRAPIGGAITRKLVEVGGMVSDGVRSVGGSAGGQLQPVAIAEIADLKGLEFHAEVDQTDIGVIKRGQQAVIVLDAFPEQRFSGTVQETTIASIEEIGGRVRYKVRVALQKSDAPLRLGMTGTVNFILTRKEHVLTLPISVLMQRGGEDSVFIVEDGRARWRPVQIGLRNEDVVEVVAGLQAGEWVIDQGRHRVRDGQPVDVLNGRR